MKISDAIILGLLLLVGYALGTGYVRAARQTHQMPGMPGLSRRVFGAAAMIACGRGMTTPSVPAVAGADTPARARALIDFLGARRDALSCAEIPADTAVDGLDGPQRASRYLILLAAGSWKLAGLAWSSIDRLLGLLFALSIGLAYLIGRLAMGRIAAAGVAVLYMLSPVHLANLLDLRDYSKAPFFSATLLIVGLIVLRPRPAVTIVACAATAGAILGLGFGVRTDIALNLVLVLAAVVGFLPGRFVDTWKVRLVAALVCASAFAAVASPILGSGASGSNLWHWALLGYAHDSDVALDIEPALYEPGYFYSDSYVATIVDAYWGRSTGSSTQVSVGFPQYAVASRQYYMRILDTFPADALLRGWAAVLRVLELPYDGTAAIPNGLLPGIAARAATLFARALARFAGLGLPLFAGVVTVVSVRSLRLATLIFGIVGYLGAYPAIQFQPRHVFHLELLSLLLLGLAASSIGLLVARRTTLAALLGRPDLRRGRWMWRPLLFASGVLTIVVLPLTTVRAYQQRVATRLFSTYDDARRDPIAMSPASIAGGDVRTSLETLRAPRSARRSMYSEMFVVELAADGCPADRPALTFRYRAADPAVDFSRTYAVERPPAGERTTVYFPAYETGAASPDPALLAIEALEVPASEWPCVKSVSRFADPDRFPLLLAAVLPTNWRTLPLHQTLRGWERPSRRDQVRPVSYWLPPELRARRGGILDRFEKNAAPPGAALDFRAPIARVDGSRVLVDGIADGSGSYLVAWTAKPMTARSVVVAEGVLEQGGLTVGLVNAAGWAAKLDVSAPGPFRVLVQAPGAGAYQVVVANHLDDRSLRNRVTISRIGLVDGEHE